MADSTSDEVKNFASMDDAPLLPSQSNVKENRQSNYVMFLSSFVMLLGAIATGTMLGLSSPLIPSIQHDTTSTAIPVGKAEASWIGSLLSVGGIVGGLTAGLVMQWLGRKFTSILSSIPYLGGLLLITYAENVWMIYVGRFISGIGVAFTSLVVPTYVIEVSPYAWRGLLGSCNQLAITIGILLVYAIGGFLTWRWLALGLAVIPVLYAFLCLFIPETPRHLYMKNQKDHSKAVLQRLRGQDADIEDELRQLHECTSANFTEASWKELVTDKSIRTPLLLTLGTMFFQQFSGINCIMFYSQSIFEEAGFKTASQLHMSLILVAGIQVIFTLISCILVDRTGRKVLWTVSSVVMCLSMVAFGTYFQLKASGNQANFRGAIASEGLDFNMKKSKANFDGKTNQLRWQPGNFSWLALGSLMIYMASFSIGLGPLPWLFMVELLPLRAKGKCGGIVTMFNLLSCFIVTKEFTDAQYLITTQGTFWLFGGICFVSVIFGLVLLPETKGRSLEEIQCHFDCDYENPSQGYERIED